VTSLEQIHPNNLAIVTDKVVSLFSGETRLNAHLALKVGNHY
jgi:hypothetical protein